MSGAAVGRERELGAIATFLAEAPHEARAVRLFGEAGIGKTTIFQAAVAEAVAGGSCVLLARPAEGEKELPYAGLGDLLDGVDGGTLAGLPDPQRAAIEVALGRRLASGPVDSHALSRGVLELLCVEGARGELMLAIDDVQWLDRPTASTLAFVLRRLGSVPLRVLVTMRSETGSPPGPALGLEDWDENVRDVEVEPLSVTELGIALGRRLHAPLSRPRLESIARASGGNPMFALELATAAESSPDPRPAVSTLPMTLTARLRELDPGARAALAVAAAALQPTVELLLRAGVDEAELRSAIDSGIVEVAGERLSFVHPLLASAAYETLLPDERRRVHARLAAAGTQAVERGYHVSRSVDGRDELAAEALDEAAAEAASLGDHAGAAEFLLRAAELSAVPDGEQAQWREVRAAAELETAGDVEAAAGLARALLDRLPSGVARALARQTLASCSSGAGLSYEDELAELALALDDAAGDDAVQAQLHVAMADISSGMCRLDESLAHLRTAIELAERAGETEMELFALAEFGFAQCMLGQGVTEAAREAFARWDGTIVSAAGYSPRMALACACIHATEFAEAARLLEEEIVTAEERGLEPVEVTARGHLAEAQLRAGNWSAALSNARLAVEHARQAANAQILTGASYPLAMTEALLGHHEAARAIATEALAVAEATGDFWFRVSHRAVLGLVAFAEDDSGGAVEVLEPAWTLMGEHDLGDLSIFPVAHVLGESLVATQRLEEATAIVEALRGSPVGDLPWSRAISGRVEALVKSARGDPDAARAAIGEALEAHTELPEPFELARTLHVVGRIERSARNWGVARTALIAALERFDALGAARWAEKTTADIGRLPGRRPVGPAELTPRERDVAELVATGLGNKEVAARLFVSVRTVESTLTRIYAKLGVRSRSELASRVARQPA